MEQGTLVKFCPNLSNSKYVGLTCRAQCIGKEFKIMFKVEKDFYHVQSTEDPDCPYYSMRPARCYMYLQDLLLSSDDPSEYDIDIDP